MTIAIATPKTTRILLLIAACFVALAYAQWGAERGLAALVGATLSLLNWLALRWFTSRIVDSGAAAGPVEEGVGASGASATGKAAISLLLIGKMGLLIAVVYVLIQHLRIDPVGLAFGLGVLFIGPIVVSLVSGERPIHPSAADAAREER
jgi:hypothetical protein